VIPPQEAQQIIPVAGMENSPESCAELTRDHKWKKLIDRQGFSEESEGIWEGLRNRPR